MEKAMHITVYRSEHRQDPQYDMTIFGCGPTTCRIVVEPKWEGTNKQGIKLVDLLEIFHRIIESPWVGVKNGSGTSMKTLLEAESIVGARLIVDNSSYRKLEIVKQVMLGRYMAEKDYTLSVDKDGYVSFTALAQPFDFIHIAAMGLALLKESDPNEDGVRIRGYIRGDKYPVRTFYTIDRDVVDVSDYISDLFVRMSELEDEYV